MAYPSTAQRARLEGFPDRISVEDVRACFALSEADRVLVFAQRGAANRLGLGVSLCAVRFLGFVPQDIASIPEDALRFLAEQVDAGPHELLAYGARAQTRSDHLQLVLAHTGGVGRTARSTRVSPRGWASVRSSTTRRRR